MHFERTLMGIALLLTIGAAAAYDGDGKFTDRGPIASTGRYIVDLGSVDLTTIAQYHYRLAGLPSEEMVAGLEVIETKPNLDGRPDHLARIRIQLESLDRQIVVLEEAPLNVWVRSYGQGDPKSFYYRRGEAREIPVRPGITKWQRIGEREDRGWGSYFTPNKNASYVLTLDVLEPDASPSRPARLLIQGGGWK